MSSDTQFWQQSKKPLSQIRLKEPTRRVLPGRDFIFRVVLPLVFLFVGFFHLFVATPESGELYMKWAATSSLRHMLAM